jgi:2-keto-3-deoxy-L-rhamnonate aldolase RhmA
MVRIRGHDTQALTRYLDMGADAVLVPHVSTHEEAQTFAQAMQHYPRASLVVVLESRRGAENAEAILATERVDAAVIGPVDLSTDLGCKGEFANPLYAEAFARIEDAAVKTGKALGTIPHGSFSLDVLRARGHRLLILGTDRALLREAMAAQTARARSGGG